MTILSGDVSMPCSTCLNAIISSPLGKEDGIQPWNRLAMRNNMNTASLGRLSTVPRSPFARPTTPDSSPNRSPVVSERQDDTERIYIDRPWESLQQSVAARCMICMRVACKYVGKPDAVRFLFNLTKCEPGFELVVYVGPETTDRHMFKITPAADLTPISKMGLLSTKEDSTGHEAVGNVLRGWLDNCTKSHMECHRGSPSNHNPSRLIEVSEEEVRLIECGEDDTVRKYATMSHCWGGKEDFLVLKPENYAQFRRGISIQEFAQSFRDVFLTVRRLGLLYIWIDCFCIVQGSSDAAMEDWRREADKMKLVYYNSFVNIGATHAANPSEGCFVTRPPSTLTTPGVFAWPDLPEEKYQIFSASKFTEDVGPDGLKSDQIFSRAWVYQERLLCPRMVHFGRDQVYWECTKTPLALESFPDGVDEDSQQYVHMPAFSTAQSVGTTTSEMLVGWHEILDQYARCALTYPTKDKLLAVGGVAKYFAESAGRDYTGGYWHSFVLPQLCWRQAPGQKASRSLEWRSPSWSWASMDGPLNFCNVDMHFEKDPEPDYKELVSSIVVSLQPKTPEDAFGPLYAGSLVLHGRLIRATVGFRVENQEPKRLRVISVDGIMKDNFGPNDSVITNFDDEYHDFEGHEDTWDVEILLLRLLPMSHRLLTDAEHRIADATIDDALRGAELQMELDAKQELEGYANYSDPPKSPSTFPYPLPKAQGLFLKKTVGSAFQRVGFLKAFHSLFLLRAWLRAEEREVTIV